MHIIIVGCGRVGARLASLLSSSGHSLVVIDKNPGPSSGLGVHLEGLLWLESASIASCFWKQVLIAPTRLLQ